MPELKISNQRPFSKKGLRLNVNQISKIHPRATGAYVVLIERTPQFNEKIYIVIGLWRYEEALREED